MMGTIINEGFVIFVIGIGIVFFVLIILWALLSIFKVFFSGIPENKNELNDNNVQVQSINIQEKDVEDDAQIVAVITAAIASMLGKSETSLKIKSIKRISKWNRV